jgi:hypothetical protein
MTMTDRFTGHQPPSSRLVRTSPTRTQLATRTPIVLTDRDQDILTWVYTHGFLTTELIELAFFPEPEHGRHSPSSRAYARLGQLWRWGYVERVELPVARSAGGRRPYLYALGRRGEPVVARRLGEGAAPARRRRLDRLSGLFVDHDLQIAAVWAHLVALLRPMRAELGRWLPERDLRAQQIRVQDPQTGRWLPVLPDAAFEVLYADGFVQGCLLEVDMGTLTLRRFRRKLRAFELALAAGLIVQDWEDDFEVVVLTHARGRLQELWRAAREQVAPERWSAYSFGTVDLLTPRWFGEAEWVTANNDLVRLLYDDASPAMAAEATAASADATHGTVRRAPVEAPCVPRG